MENNRIQWLAMVLLLPPLAVLGAWLLQLNHLRLAEPLAWLPVLSIILAVDGGMGALGPWLWRRQIEGYLAQHSFMADLPLPERTWRAGLFLTLYPLLDGLVLVILGGTLIQMLAFAAVSMAAATAWTVERRQ